MADVYFNCPHCGRQIRASAGSNMPNSPNSTFFESTAAPPPWSNDTPAPGDFERRRPVRAPAAVPDLWVPLGQAAVVGIFAAAASALASAFIDWPLWIAPIAGMAGLAIGWIHATGAARATMHHVERWTAGGSAPPPVVVAPAPPIRVEVKTGQRWQFAEISSARPDALKAFAGQVTAGVSFAERVAVDAGLTQQQFGELRDTFLTRGWVAWRGKAKQAGLTVTSTGRMVLRAIASTPLPGNDEEG